MSEKLYRARVKLANELGATRQQTFAVVKITTAKVVLPEPKTPSQSQYTKPLIKN